MITTSNCSVFIRFRPLNPVSKRQYICLSTNKHIGGQTSRGRTFGRRHSTKRHESSPHHPRDACDPDRDPDHVQIVKRDEAANALRKAAELGNPFAMHRLAVILERGEMVKRDNAQAIYWPERSLQKPDGEWGDADIATLLGRLLTQSDDPA